MLDTFIIEELRRREEEERNRRSERPTLELPIQDRELPRRAPERNDRDRDGGERGIIVIDL